MPGGWVPCGRAVWEGGLQGAHAWRAPAVHARHQQTEGPAGGRYSETVSSSHPCHQCCGSGSVGSVCFGPPGSGSFYHQAKIVRKTLIPTLLWLSFDFLSLKNDVNVPSKRDKLVFRWRLEGQSMMKIAGSGSISQRHVSADPHPHQNVMDPQHCLPISSFFCHSEIISNDNVPQRRTNFETSEQPLSVYGSGILFYPHLFRPLNPNIIRMGLINPDLDHSSEFCV